MFYSDIADALSTIVGTDNSTLTVSVSNVYTNSGPSGAAGYIWSVTFLTPVGNVPSLGVALGSQGAGTVYTSCTSSLSSDTCVYEYIQGKSPSTGTFTIYYEGSYTADIPYNGGAAVVKKALESLSNIGAVQVVRDDTNNGFKWTVMFTQNSGNLRMLVITPPPPPIYVYTFIPSLPFRIYVPLSFHVYICSYTYVCALSYDHIHNHVYPSYK